MRNIHLLLMLQFTRSTFFVSIRVHGDMQMQQSAANCNETKPNIHPTYTTYWHWALQYFLAWHGIVYLNLVPGTMHWTGDLEAANEDSRAPSLLTLFTESHHKCCAHEHTTTTMPPAAQKDSQHSILHATPTPSLIQPHSPRTHECVSLSYIMRRVWLRSWIWDTFALGWWPTRRIRCTSYYA